MDFDRRTNCIEMGEGNPIFGTNDSNLEPVDGGKNGKGEEMSNKTQRYFILIFICLTMLSGCMPKEELPRYLWEKRNDGKDVFFINGKEYMYDRNLIYPYTPGIYGSWCPEGVGEQIGLCVYSEDSKRGAELYMLEGCDDMSFLYTKPNYFVIGAYDTPVWIREDISLDYPQPSNISHFAAYRCVEDEKGNWDWVFVNEYTDQMVVEGVLATWNIEDADAQIMDDFSDEDKFLLRLYHKDYPYLYCPIIVGREEGSSMLYVDCQDRRWRKSGVNWIE